MEDADVLVSLPDAVAAARPVEDAQHRAGRLDRDGHARIVRQPDTNRECVFRWVGSLNQEEPSVPPGAEADDSRLCLDAASNRERSVTGQGADGCCRLQRSLLVTRGQIDETAHQLDVPSNLSGKPLAHARNGHRLAALVADLDRRAETSNLAASPAHVAEHNDRRSAERLQRDPQLRASTARGRPIRCRIRTGARFPTTTRRPQLDRQPREGNTSDSDQDRQGSGASHLPHLRGEQHRKSLRHHPSGNPSRRPPGTLRRPPCPASFGPARAGQAESIPGFRRLSGGLLRLGGRSGWLAVSGGVVNARGDRSVLLALENR